MMQRLKLLHTRNLLTQISSKDAHNIDNSLLQVNSSHHIEYRKKSSAGLSSRHNCKSHLTTSDCSIHKPSYVSLYHRLRFATDSKARKDDDSAIESFGAWDNDFELPLQMDSSIQHGTPIPRIRASDVGCKSNLGKRVYQEDRFFLKDLEGNILCCAVFDGHGGSDCSSFCSEKLETVLERNRSRAGKDLETLLHHTILELHTMYRQWVEENKKGERCGTTCTICLLRGGHELVVGHVGDSRALLCRRGAPRRLTTDHCPSNLSERKRVEQSGGTVATDNIGRHMVNSALSMSRSIGDLHLKRFGVTALPDTRSLQVKHGHDSFLLLTTDGINFVLNDDEICDVINHAQDPQSAAASLVDQALSNSAEDNLTALVVPLGSWGKFAKSAVSMFYSFGIGRDMTKSSRFG